MLCVALAGFSKADDETARFNIFRDRAADAVKHGDISAARRLLEPLAKSGDAPAARALAETYDPAWLAKHGVLNIGGLSDIEVSLGWYKRAAELGDSTPGNRFRDQ